MMLQRSGSYHTRKKYGQVGDTKDKYRNTSLRKRFKKNPSSKTHKFKKMMVLCKAILDYASTLGTKEFNEKMDTLATMYDAWLSEGKVIFKAEEADEAYPCVTPETPIISAPSPSKNDNMVPSPKTSESAKTCLLPHARCHHYHLNLHHYCPKMTTWCPHLKPMKASKTCLLPHIRCHHYHLNLHPVMTTWCLHLVLVNSFKTGLPH